jgi:hypothetical protein
LVIGHRADGNEVDQSLRRQWTGIPVVIVARLLLFRSVDAEHADPLTAKLQGIAIGDREAMRGSDGYGEAI